MEFANSTQMQLEPGASADIDLSTLGVQYTTPGVFQVTLEDLTRLSYIKGKIAAHLVADSATTAVVTVSLKSANATYWSASLDFAGTAQAGISESVDLSNVAGSEALFIEVDVTTIEAGKTATLKSALTVSHPLMISGCG